MNLLSRSEHLQPSQTFQRVTRAKIKAENSDCLSVGDASIDAALGVTLRTGQIIQLSGPPGVGKTQTAMQMIAQTLLSVCRHDPKKRILLLQTEGTFAAERLQQIVAERSGRAGVKWMRPPLDQLLVEHVSDGEKLMYILRGRLQWMASEVCLIVIDSIANVFRHTNPDSTNDE